MQSAVKLNPSDALSSLNFNEDNSSDSDFMVILRLIVITTFFWWTMTYLSIAYHLDFGPSLIPVSVIGSHCIQALWWLLMVLQQQRSLSLKISLKQKDKGGRR